jgi:MinD-like ATPase involved in chromosome partitioning or flagellar assembly
MIFTFYSFKGGVGRSMALANVAELLYQRGLRVLMIDFDLEAPGLERFFEIPDAPPLADVLETRGIIDLVESYKELRQLAAMAARQRAAPDPAGSSERPALGVNESAESLPAESLQVRGNGSGFPFPVEPLATFVIRIHEEQPNGGALYLVPSGRRGGPELARYSERIRRFDWDDFYANWDGEAFFDWFRHEAEQLADVVLVDSRTGITELSGVCTFHLPDAVVMFVAPNHQNLEGVRVMAKSLSAEGVVSEGRRGRPLSLLFVPSRVEHSESELLAAFSADFQRLLGEFMSPDVIFRSSPFIDLKVPYIPRYAYVEAVAARELDSPVATDIVAAYERLILAMIELSPRDGELYKRFTAPPEGPQSMARTGISRTEHFVGRTWVFKQLNDWLDEREPTALLITGGPGSGKTALISRLLEMDGGTVAPASPRLGPGFVSAFHACSPFDSDPLHFVEDLAEQLAARYPTFARALAAAVTPEIKVDVKQTIGAGSYGSQVTGVSVGSVRLTGISPVRAFQQVIREPLRALCEPGFTDTVLLVIDGLDVAVADARRDSIVSLLSHAITGNWLPVQVRILATTRPDPRVTGELPGTVVDLGEDPNSTSDIAEYVDRYLADQHPEAEAAATFSRQIVAASDGNFLYASLAVAQLMSPGAPGYESALLPKGLAGFYRTAFQAATRGEHWSGVDQRFLGVLAVAYPPGLTLAEIARIMRRPSLDVQKAAQSWAQFLKSTGQKEERLRLYHPSLADFLLSDTEYGVDAGECHRAIIDALVYDHEAGWGRRDIYALTNGPRHLVEAARMSVDRGSAKQLLERLAELLVDESFRTAKARLIGPDRVLDDVSSALALADSFGDLSPVARANLATARVSLVGSARPADRGRPDSTRDIHGLLESDETVLVGTPFALTVGLSASSTSSPAGTERTSVPDAGPYQLDVQLFADGFDIAPGESWRQRLAITSTTPFPSAIVKVTARELLEPKAIRTISAIFSVEGQPVGLATRQIVVTTNPTVLRATQVQPTRTATSIQAPATVRPADVTLYVTRGLEPGALVWSLESSQPGIALQDGRPIFSDIGSDPRSFAAGITRNLSLGDTGAGVQVRLRGIGKLIAAEIPSPIISAIKQASAAAAPRPLEILLCTDEPSIPWELAWIDEPFDRAAPNYLGAQANLGRWIVDASTRRNPVQDLRVSTMAIVSGVYQGRYPRLGAAEEEARQLQVLYRAVSVDAQPEPVLSLLAGKPPADILHFAVHGTYDSNSATQAIYLVSGTPIDSLQVSGSDLSERTPFVFLNTAQVSSVQAPIGDYGGMAQAFLRAGASGVLVAIWPIPDDDAQRIALDLYAELLGSAAQAGGVLNADQAPPAIADVLRRARARLSGDDGGLSSYLAYQFYGHPSLRLSWRPTS